MRAMRRGRRAQRRIVTLGRTEATAIAGDIGDPARRSQAITFAAQHEK